MRNERAKTVPRRERERERSKKIIISRASAVLLLMHSGVTDPTAHTLPVHFALNIIDFMFAFIAYSIYIFHTKTHIPGESLINSMNRCVNVTMP